MLTFNTFVKRFNKLQAFIKKRSEQILLNTDELVEMVREQQLAGVNAEGKTMQRGYSKAYLEYRKWVMSSAPPMVPSERKTRRVYTTTMASRNRGSRYFSICFIYGLFLLRYRAPNSREVVMTSS